MKKNFSKEGLVGIAFVSLFLCLVFVACYCHVQMVKHCAAKGGHIENRNCRTSTTFATHCSSNGSNCVTVPETHTYCDELCIDNNNTNHVLPLD